MRVVATHVALPGGHRLLTGRESIRFESLVDLFWYDIAGATLLVLALVWLPVAVSPRAPLGSAGGQPHGRRDCGGRLFAPAATHGRSDALGTLARTVNGMLDQLRQPERAAGEHSRRAGGAGCATSRPNWRNPRRASAT